MYYIANFPNGTPSPQDGSWYRGDYSFCVCTLDLEKIEVKRVYSSIEEYDPVTKRNDLHGYSFNCYNGKIYLRESIPKTDEEGIVRQIYNQVVIDTADDSYKSYTIDREGNIYLEYADSEALYYLDCDTDLYYRMSLTEKDENGSALETTIDRLDIPSTYRNDGWFYHFTKDESGGYTTLIRENTDGAVETIGTNISDYFIFENQLYLVYSEKDAASSNYNNIYRFTDGKAELVWENPGNVSLMKALYGDVVYNAGGRYIGISCHDSTLNHKGEAYTDEYGTHGVNFFDFLIIDTETGDSKIVQYQA